MSESYTSPFGEVLARLLVERPEFKTALHAPNWSHFAKQLAPKVSYESLRKAVAGERAPSMKIMEAVAEVLDVEPTEFREYRLGLAQRLFDPTEIGEEAAYANLEWLERLGVEAQQGGEAIPRLM